MGLIQCDQVTVSYEGQPVLKNISFNVEKGDYVCLVGANGSGKSTLMKAMLQLVPIEKGKITLSGISAKEIGYLPQHTLVQRDFPASVFEIVLSGCLNRRGLRPFYSKNERLHAEERLMELDIENLKHKSYQDLSGGQKQRVLLARALCASSGLLMLDEPIAGLDPAAAASFYEVVAKLNKEMDMTIVMISHDLEKGVKDATKIFELHPLGIPCSTLEDGFCKLQNSMSIGGAYDGKRCL